MTKKMLIDATHHEETRVVVLDGNRLDEFDYESKMRRQLKGNIFLAKVTRVEPSLQAAFVNFGGNRHGFLPFAEIHPDYYRIPVADREALLAEQQAMEEAARAADDAEDEDEDNEQPEHMDAEGFVEEAATGDAATDGEEQADETTTEDSDDDAQNDNESDDTVDAAADDDQPDDVSEEMSEDGDDVEEAEPANGENGDMPANGDEPQPEGQNGEQPRGRGRNGERGGRRGRWNNNRRGGQRGGRYMGSRSKRDEMSDDGPVSLHARFRRKYKIQEVIKRGQIMLIQVSKEERGNKGAAVTTYLSLPGRYCVLMPNSPRGGGVSRKIGNFSDRRRLKDMLNSLEIPSGMSVILRTAGVERDQPEIKRDLDYLLRLWDNIRELTLKSTAPAIIYEEGDLIKRAIRDIYSEQVEDIQIAGEDGFNEAVDFMKLLMPSDIDRIKLYDDPKLPLFQRYQVENQINDIGEPIVNLKSGGYIVINQTEALVAIDVNSGRATKERHIEETALKTNLEAADEIARQLRLRDLGGLVVIDFIDMEDRRNNAKVERRVKDALSGDRARIQVSRISSFGLLEMSRQRLNPSLTEATFQKCPHCAGFGHVKTVDFASIAALRALEEEGIRGRSTRINLFVPNALAIYILNEKRNMLGDIERRYGFAVTIHVEDDLAPGGYRVEAVKVAEPDSDDDDGDDQPQRRDRRDEGRHHRARPVAIDDSLIHNGNGDNAPVPSSDADADDSPTRSANDDVENGDDAAGNSDRAPRERNDRSDRPDRGDRGPRRSRGGRNRNRGPRRDNDGGGDQPARNVEGGEPASATAGEDAPAPQREGRENNRGPRRNNNRNDRGPRSEGGERGPRNDRGPRPDRGDRPPRDHNRDGGFAPATSSAPSEKSQPTYFVSKRRSATPGPATDASGDVDGNRADGPETHTKSNALDPNAPKKKGWWGRFS